MDETSAVLSKKVQKIYLKIPEDATKYVTEKYMEIVEVALPYYDTLVCDEDEYLLGTPFVIYTPSEYNWNSTYYFPLISNNDIVLLISLIDTNYGWSISASEEMVDELNLIGYNRDTSWIFYEQNGNVIAKSPIAEETIIENLYVTDTLEISMQDDAELTYEEYVDKISEEMNKINQFNVDAIIESTKGVNVLETYSP